MLSYNIETGLGSFKKTINIELPTVNRVGVLVSGGADSAILLYLLAKLNLENGNPCRLIPFTVPKTDGAIVFARKIVGYINQLLNCDLPQTTVVGDIKLHHSQQVLSGSNEAFDNYGIDIVVYGSQKTPPTTEMYVDGNWDYPVRPDKIYYPNAYCPFAFVDKRNTIDLYRIFNRMDLLSITHSCTENATSRCGKCLFCQERAWALKENNLIDTGEL
jgi:hypothetical protein